ncbi:MAG: glycosyltransferase family 4 protein [Desulfobacteraceae bacterium]|nr:glycosyltransferase family 4 protein [Desulfobacteraceae bacterium]
MNIGILYQYGLMSSGSGVYVARLAEELWRKKHTVHVFCLDVPESYLDRVGKIHRYTPKGATLLRRSDGPARYSVHLLQGRLRPVAYHRSEVPGCSLLTRLDDVEIEEYINWQAEQIKGVAQAVGLEVLHANHAVLMPSVAARIKTQLGIRFVVTIHGSSIEYVVNNDPRYRAYAENALAQADRVIALNRDVEERTLAICPAARVDTVPVGVDVAMFHPLSSDAGQAAHPIQEVVYAGKLSLDKGVHCLLVAAPIILSRAPHARLVMIGADHLRPPMKELSAAIGRGDMPAAAETLQRAAAMSGSEQFIPYVTRFWESINRTDYLSHARSARMDKRVVFTGQLSQADIAWHLSRAALNVIPSVVKEAFPLVSLEALSSGVLSVAPYYGGLAPLLDIISQRLGPVGRMAQIRHGPETLTADLAQRIPRLLSMVARSDVRRRVRDQCRRLATTRYDWSVVAGQIGKIYGEIVHVPSKGTTKR